MLVAPASSEFSISSFTAELTQVITCELAISRTVDEGSRFIVKLKKYFLRKLVSYLRVACRVVKQFSMDKDPL